MFQKLMVYFLKGMLSVIIIGLFNLKHSLSETTINTSAKYAILIDYDTGRVLLNKSSNVAMAPASMSKLMTIYMAFEAIKQDRINLDTLLLVSENAWRKKDKKNGKELSPSGSSMFLEPLTKVSVEDLLKGIIIQSGNDACIVIAEALNGSEEGFSEQMNNKAIELGLKDSFFTNSTGWPDKKHLMSSFDLAILASKLYEDFPEYMHYFAEKKFTYNGIAQSNRNPVLYQDIGADGLKTGYTRVSGHGVVASAIQNGRRLVLVLNGIKGTKLRAIEAERVLSWGFREFENIVLFEKNEIVDSANIWLGNRPTVPLIVKEKIILTLPKANKKNDLKAIVKYIAPLIPPLSNEDSVAKLLIKNTKGELVSEHKLYPEYKISRAGPIGRLFGSLSYLIWGNPIQ
jgi:serine-type D-Ala-D-Ala carboxypeptidase (penicillin-binding protein 5/6)